MKLPKLVARIIVINGCGQILLVRRSKTAPLRVFDWEFPGGMVEYNEEPKIAAIRELQEETGIIVNDANYIYAKTAPSLEYTALFFYGLTDNPSVKLSYEHDRYIWANPSEALEMLTLPGFKNVLTLYGHHQNKNHEVDVSVKCLINYKNNNLFIKRSATSRMGAGYWDLPGGGMEPNETIKQSLERELQEETELTADELNLVFAHSEINKEINRTKIRIGLLGDTNSSEPRLSSEHSDYKWLPKGIAYEFTKHPNWPGWGDFVKIFG